MALDPSQSKSLVGKAVVGSVPSFFHCGGMEKAGNAHSVANMVRMDCMI